MTSTRKQTEESERRLAEDLKNIRAHSIKPGTREMELYLSAGYPEIQTRKRAEEIINTRVKSPMTYPYELETKARAFLAALDAKPGDNPPAPDPHPFDPEHMLLT